MSLTTTDCRSEVGITVGIIDSIITMARLLSERDLGGYETAEALKDLRADPDFLRVAGSLGEAKS